MNTRMKIFNTDIMSGDGIITIVYSHLGYSGVCKYEKSILSGGIKRSRRELYLLKDTDMGDIIECLYKMGDIVGPQDLGRVSYMIRDDSRERLEEYLKKDD